MELESNLTEHIVDNDKLLFSWHNVRASTIPSKPLMKFSRNEDGNTILNNISGEAFSGEMLAIMGASGAGKTTLLNILSGRKSEQIDSTGKFKLNGQNLSLSTVLKLSAFVKQFENYLPFLTVKEHLLFYARLKLGNEMTVAAIEERVNLIIQKLQLGKCAASYIGMPGFMKTLSGGEYRRLVLATEIITDVPLILCDEPTTGLDSNMAAGVLCALKELANAGKVVICTIHQPSSGLFAMFNRVLLLSSGKVVYSGKTPDALMFFDKLGFRMPENTNPADFFIKVISLVPGHEENCQDRIDMFCRTFQVFQVIQEDHSATVPAVEQRRSFKKYIAKTYSLNGIRTSFWTQVMVLMSREIKMKIRANKSFIGPSATVMIYAILLAVCFGKQEMTDVGAANLGGVVFSTAMGIGYFPVIFESVFFWNLILSSAFLVIVYFSTGLPYIVSTFFWQILIFMVGIFTSISFGILYAVFFNNLMVITEMFNVLMVLLVTTSGFFFNIRSTPIYFKWLGDVCFLTKLIETTFDNVYGSIGHLECLNSINTTCLDTGDKYLEAHGYVKDNFYKDLWVIVLCGVIFFCTANLIHYVRAKKFKE